MDNNLPFAYLVEILVRIIKVNKGGVDGISLFLILLTSLLVPLAVLSGWESVNERAGAYLVHLLAIEALVLGFFMAVDVFLLYVFWTAMLVPIALLIEVWGSGFSLRVCWFASSMVSVLENNSTGQRPGFRPR